jgi:hypothetical protein
VILTSARYGGKDAKLGIDDICDLTGLAPRTLKSAVSVLCKSGLLVRVRRSRLLSVPLLYRTAATNHRNPFTKKQDATIATILARISELRGIDGSSLIVPEEYAVRLGFNSPINHAQAYETLKSTGTRALAGIFVKSLVALYNHESIQGCDLL